MVLPARAARVALTAGLILIAPSANAGAPVPAGRRALLTLNVQIDGSGQRTSKSDGIDAKWSTHRALDAKVELIADDAQKTNGAEIKRASTANYVPSNDMAALQKEAQKCKPDDVECQMSVAMKMMNTDDAKKLMQQDAATDAAPRRYQPWKAPSKGARIEVKAEYQEQWEGVFLTASREVRSCKSEFSSAAPAVAAKDRETLQSGLQGNRIEIDTQTGKSWLMPVVGSYVMSELQCHINDGGRVSNERENKPLTFAPPIDQDATGGWLAGSSPSGTAIARGEISFATKPEARALTGMMSVTAPLKVRIRWELTPQ